MAWNLPKAWSPGLVLPGNVRDEGLQRRAFVTQWAPNGTFDNPRVGTGGYVVPGYIVKEGYGRGTYTTKWAPRGTYYGPRIPDFLSRPTAAIVAEKALSQGGMSYEVVTEGMSGFGDDAGGDGNDAALPEPFGSFGVRAARTVMSHVKSLPVARRRSRMKAILDKIDPSLWSRTEKAAKVYTRVGVPAPVALEKGLGKAMGAGLAAEVIHLGKTGKKPRAALGCTGYGLAGYPALGDTAASRAITNAFGRITGTCTPPEGYTWDAQSGAYVDQADWRASPVSAPGCPAPGTVPVRTSSEATQKLYYNLTMPDGSMPPMKIRGHNKAIAWKIGFNTAPGQGYATANLPPKAKDWLKKVLTTGDGDYAVMSKVVENFRALTPGPTSAQEQVFNGQLASLLRPLGLTAASGINFEVLKGNVPVARAKHPLTGDDYELRVVLDRNAPMAQEDGVPVVRKAPLADAVGRAYHPDMLANPLALYVVWAPKHTSVLGSVWDGLKWLVVEIWEGIAEVLGAIGDLACAALGSKAGVAGGMVAGGMVAGPPGAAAGANGAALASAACGNQAPPFYMPSSDDWLLPVAILGGLGVVLLATRKKEP